MRTLAVYQWSYLTLQLGQLKLQKTSGSFQAKTEGASYFGELCQYEHFNLCRDLGTEVVVSIKHLET